MPTQFELIRSLRQEKFTKSFRRAADTIRARTRKNRQGRQKGFSMIQLKIRRYNATDTECQLCGVVPGYVWKIGRVTVTNRAFHFCDACAKIVDANTASGEASR